jgi:hypothetical protein
METTDGLDVVPKIKDNIQAELKSRFPAAEICNPTDVALSVLSSPSSFHIGKSVSLVTSVLPPIFHIQIH